MRISVGSLVLLLSAGSVLAKDRGPRKQQVRQVATSSNSTIIPRSLHPGPFAGGKGTWYVLEGRKGDQVACGGFFTRSEFVVALNQDQYGDLNARSPYCDHEILITANGKQAKAKIVDACPKGPDTCHFGSLDMSQDLFKHFASLDVGVIDLRWHLLDGGPLHHEDTLPLPEHKHQSHHHHHHHHGHKPEEQPEPKHHEKLVKANAEVHHPKHQHHHHNNHHHNHKPSKKH